MNQQEAISLIRRAVLPSAGPQQWADLGCGSGVFTTALAHLLPPGSRINAVDKEQQSLPQTISGVEIIFRQADFEREVLPFRDLDGILIANALHYCSDAGAVLRRLMASQRPESCRFLIVEYDSTAASRWVPFPLPFDRMEKLFLELGADRVTKLAEHPSRYRRGNIYSCVAIGPFNADP